MDWYLNVISPLCFVISLLLLKVRTLWSILIFALVVIVSLLSQIIAGYASDLGILDFSSLSFMFFLGSLILFVLGLLMFILK